MNVLKVIHGYSDLRIYTESLPILGPSTSDSPSFHYQNGTILYKKGLFKQNRIDMRTLCQKCHDALSKEHIPRFSAGNNIWLGDISAESHSSNIIENIQLLHECKKDRDEHLLQVIAEAQTDNDAIDPMILPANQDVHNEYDMDENDDLLELLGNLGEYTTAAIGATKKSTEDQYIEETVKAVENVGRFSHINSKYSTLRLISRTENQCVKIVLGHSRSSLNEFADYSNRQVVPFTSATPDLIRLNKKWQEQLKAEKERARRSLITGNYDEADDVLDLHAAKDAVVTVVDPNNYNKKKISRIMPQFFQWFPLQLTFQLNRVSPMNLH